MNANITLAKVHEIIIYEYIILKLPRFMTCMFLFLRLSSAATFANIL